MGFQSMWIIVWSKVDCDTTIPLRRWISQTDKVARRSLDISRATAKREESDVILDADKYISAIEDTDTVTAHIDKTGLAVKQVSQSDKSTKVKQNIRMDCCKWKQQNCVCTHLKDWQDSSFVRETFDQQTSNYYTNIDRGRRTEQN